MSLTMRDDKFKLDEKINKLGNNSDLVTQLRDDMEKKLNTLTANLNKSDKSSSAAEDLSKNCSRDIQQLKSEVSSIKTSVDKCVKNVDDNGGKIFGCVQDCDMLKDSLGEKCMN